MSEVARLQEYHDFSDETLAAVSEAAGTLRDLETWPQIGCEIKKMSGQTQHYPPTQGNPIEVFDIMPKDPDQTVIYHLPMGNGVDPNMQTRLLTLAKVLPNTRIIAAGNPSVPASDSGILDRRDRQDVRTGNFEPAVSPVLEYSAKSGAEKVIQVGFSYGADKGIVATRVSEAYDLLTTNAILMEPASIRKRGRVALALAFMSTEKHLQEYVDQTDWAGYEDARELAAEQSGNLAGYVLGLLRASNIAIGSGIAKGRFENFAVRAALSNPELALDVIWGTESELSTDTAMRESAVFINGMVPDAKVRFTPIEGQYHAMGDDVFLHAALVHDALTKTQV